MDNTADRSVFLKKISLFSTLCLTGTTTSYANISNTEPTSGFIIKAGNGEVLYIGNTRKAKVVIKISKTTKYTPEMSLLTEVITPGDGIPVHKHLNEQEFFLYRKAKLKSL